MERYLEFKAVGNVVVGVMDSGMVARGYANEEQVVVCTCASLPGWIAKDVAQEVARLLNEAQPVLPYTDVSKHVQEVTDE